MSESRTINSLCNALATADIDKSVNTEEISELDAPKSETTDDDEEVTSCKRKRNKTTKFSIPHISFKRLVKEIAHDFSQNSTFTKNAIDALQTAAEEYIIQLLKCGQDITLHSDRWF